MDWIGLDTNGKELGGKGEIWRSVQFPNISGRSVGFISHTLLPLHHSHILRPLPAITTLSGAARSSGRKIVAPLLTAAASRVPQ